MSARSQTATSAANLLNSLTWASRSEVHRLMISSNVLPLSTEGGATATAGLLLVVVAPGRKGEPTESAEKKAYQMLK